jgi:hypothetical protein
MLAAAPVTARAPAVAVARPATLWLHASSKATSGNKAQMQFAMTREFFHERAPAANRRC